MEFRFDFILEPDFEFPDFELFLELPKELREEIYLNVFNRPKDPTSRLLVRYQDRPIEPAICRVSKAIREETLPLFYHLFELQIDVLAVASPRRKPLLSFGSEWWRYIPSQKFCWLRTVEISFWDAALYFGRRLSIELNIRLSTRKGKHQYSLDIVPNISTWRLHNQWLQLPSRAAEFDEFIKHKEKVVVEIRAHSILVLDWLTSDEKFGKWTPADLRRLIEWDDGILLLR